MRETLAKLTEDDALSPDAFWKLRRSISRNCQLKLPAVYKRNGGVATKAQEIKQEVNEEFAHRLRNRESQPGWEGYVKATKELVEELMKEDANGPPFIMEEMKEAISKMKRGTSPDYYNMHAEMLLHAGKAALEALLQVLNIIKTTRRTPEKWRNVLITMIFKNKGSHLDLVKYRGIFLTVLVSKLFERMIQMRMKPSLEKVSLFQAGSRTERGAPDNLYLLRSSIDHSKYMNNCIYVTTYDYQQAFDSLWLQDCILVLQKLGVEKYILQLIYEMNKKAIVQVKTPYGLTDPTEVYDIVKQGGVLGSPLCSATTAEYCTLNNGIAIGDVVIATLAFVDDIADISGSFEDAISAHNNAIIFSLKKKLTFSPDKCYIMIVNNRRNNGIPDLYIDGQKVDNVDVIKYLGDIFNSKGNNNDLMEDRRNRGIAAMVSIQGFMREANLGFHTLNVYLLLYHSIFLPSTIFNSQAWSNICEKNIKRIRIIQLRFLKRMIGVKQGTNNSFMFLEVGVLPVEYEIHKRQFSFLYHIVSLEENDPVKKMWRSQQALPDYGNWWNDIKILMETYGLKMSEDEIKKISKDTFKRKVKKAIEEKAFEKLKQAVREKSKTKELQYNKFDTQEYILKLNPNHSRIIFQCRSKSLNIKKQQNYKYINGGHCRWCGVVDETLEHIVNCGPGNKTKLYNVEHTVLHENDTLLLKRIAERIEDFLDRVEM